MKTIWKYKINHQKTQLNVRLNSKLLHVGLMGGDIQVWFEVDTEETEEEIREFHAFYTGANFDDYNMKFIKTIVLSEYYVLHIYEYREENFLKDNEMTL